MPLSNYATASPKQHLLQPASLDHDGYYIADTNAVWRAIHNEH